MKFIFLLLKNKKKRSNVSCCCHFRPCFTYLVGRASDRMVGWLVACLTDIFVFSTKLSVSALARLNNILPFCIYYLSLHSLASAHWDVCEHQRIYWVYPNTYLCTYFSLCQYVMLDPILSGMVVKSVDNRALIKSKISERGSKISSILLFRSTLLILSYHCCIYACPSLRSFKLH